MPLTLLRHAVQKPPVGPLKLDVGHPLAAGLTVAAALNEIGSSTIANNYASPGSQGFTPVGGSARFTWTGNGLSLTAAPDAEATLLVTPSFPITMVVRYWPFDWNTANHGVMQIGSVVDAAGKAFEIFTGTGNGLNARINGDESVAGSNVAGMDNRDTTINSPHTSGLSYAANSVAHIYHDGTLRSTFTGITPYVGNSTLRLGVVETLLADCVIECVYVWSRELTPAEVAQITAEPYCLFQTRPIQRWFGVGQPLVPLYSAPVVTQPVYRSH